MARIQYQRAARASGYRPQQAGDSALRRQQEEADRTLQGMRTVANAEIEARQTFLRQMKENDEYTRGAKQRNFEIATQNDQRQIRGLQQQAQRDVEQYNADSKARATIFESISTISKTAADTVTKIYEEDKKAEVVKAAQAGMSGENALAKQVDKYNLALLDMQKQAALQQHVTKGGDPVIAAEMTANSDALAVDMTEAQQVEYWKFHYEDDRNGYLEAKQQELGRALTPEEEQLYTGEFRNMIIGAMGELSNFSTSLVAPYITKYADTADSAKFAETRRKRQKVADELTIERSVYAISYADPEEFQRVATTHLPKIMAIQGRTEGLKTLEGMFKVRDPKTGERLRNLEELGNLRIFPQGAPKEGVLYRDWFAKNRWPEVQVEVDRLDVEFQKQQIQAENAAATAEANQLVRGLGPTPSLAQVEEAENTLWVKHNKVDPRISTHAKKFTIEARLREAETNRIAALPTHALTQEVMERLKVVAPTDVYERIDSRYQSFAGGFGSKDGLKIMNTGIAGITGQADFSDIAQQGTGLAVLNFKRNALNTARQLLADGLVNGATNQEKQLAALQMAVDKELEKHEIQKDKPGSDYHKTVDQMGRVSYPTLEKKYGKPSAIDNHFREVTRLRKMIKTLKPDGFLNVPNAFMSAERMEYIANNPNTPPNAIEFAVSQMLPDVPMHELRNFQFKAAGRPERFESPLKPLGIELTGALSNELRNASPTARAALLTREMGDPGGTFKTNFRAGSPLQQVLVTDPTDDTSRSTGSDFVIQNGERGARYLIPQDGTVLKVVKDRPEEFRVNEGDTRSGYGNHVEIRFDTPYGPADFLFSHFDKVGDFKAGQVISRGTFMGTQGRSGSTTGAHISVDAFDRDSPNPNPRARDWFLKTYLQQ